ncbi:hypothetical protein JZ751_009612 [Albula glossodonta]|uniref:Uncharacterized protein n=1 Tax=Albula glossodonta TaxID=121402 RepID=A0A8T2P131_9TELE|nr:hypothetical protein JZ751_009612 [Albula glossodonta]
MKREFEYRDSKSSGTITLQQMKSALEAEGVTLDSETYEAVWRRYSSEGGMTYDNFIANLMKLQALKDRFQKRAVPGLACTCPVATFALEDCLWCQTNSSCMDYPVKHVLPPSSLCKLSEARWGVCWVNFEALIIAMGVVGGTLLLSIIVCCCCCCCRSRPAGPDRDEERFARRREEIRQRSENRKAERRARHDEIRKKYGTGHRAETGPQDYRM